MDYGFNPKRPAFCSHIKNVIVIIILLLFPRMFKATEKEILILVKILMMWQLHEKIRIGGTKASILMDDLFRRHPPVVTSEAEASSEVSFMETSNISGYRESFDAGLKDLERLELQVRKLLKCNVVVQTPRTFC